MIEHGGRPGEPSYELKPEARLGRDADVIERGHERGDGTTVHLLMRSITAVEPHDVRIVTERAGVCGGSAKLFGPVCGEPLGMFRMDPALEGVSEDRVDQAASMPRLSKCQ